METVEHDFSLIQEAMRAAQRRAELLTVAQGRALWFPKLGSTAMGIGLGLALAMVGLSFAQTIGRPSPEVEVSHFPKFPKSNEATPRSESSKTEKVVKDYVIFHIIETAEGRIETGWHYANENQTRPDRQWCQLVTQAAEGNGTITPYDSLSIEQKGKCRWYLGVIQNG